MILSPQGKHLGTVIAPKHPHNLAWADDGSVLYTTASTAVYQILLRTKGNGF